MQEKSYKVKESTLRRLIAAEAELQALESGGVDNWSWYCESKQEYLEDYFSDCDPEFFDKNDIGFNLLVDKEINKFEEV